MAREHQSPVIAGVGDGADGADIDEALHQHAVESCGHSGHQFQLRTAGMVAQPTPQESPAPVQPMVERIAVEETDVSHPDRHLPAPSNRRTTW